MDISIIIPLYNSGIRAPQLYQALVSVLPVNNKYEIIFVDDGSNDNTAEIVRKIKESDQRVRLIELEKNMGQYRALFLGYKYSKGDIVISLDDDAFDGVKYIPEFIKKINEGFDIVLGWRGKKGYPFVRKIASSVFNDIISLLIGLKIHDIGSPIKARNRKIVDKLVSLGELTSFLKYYKFYKVTEINLSYNYSNKFPTRYNIVKLIKSALLIIKNNIFVGK